MPINLETIKSVFDDDLTLMQWLSTVEDAVKNDTLEGVTIKKKPYHNEYAFDFLFKDGTHLETNYIAVGKGDKGDKGDTGAQGPQGPQGPQGETGPQGLTPHIDNVSGNWFIGEVDTNVQARGPQGLQGPAGSTGAQGATGPQGETGPQGVGINSMQITNGHLMITLTNSTTIDAGLVLNFPTTDINCANLTATGDIVETNTGFSFHPATVTGLTFDYAGVSKIGNKVTFVLACKVNTSSGLSNISLGYFGMPSSVGEKIVNSMLGADNVAYEKYVQAFKSVAGTPINLPCRIRKQTNTQLDFILYSGSQFELNTDYIFRIEATFLLTTNLVGS